VRGSWVVHSGGGIDIGILARRLTLACWRKARGWGLAALKLEVVSKVRGETGEEGKGFLRATRPIDKLQSPFPIPGIGSGFPKTQCRRRSVPPLSESAETVTPPLPVTIP
jgi:hypothetical protein